MGSSAPATKCDYYRYNHFGDGCQYIVFNVSEASTLQVQNYNFAQGLQGTSDAYLNVTGARGLEYVITVAKNASGTVKTYCATS